MHGTFLPKINRTIALMAFVEHFHVFIGDLSQDVESHQLREAFTPFGEIS